MLNKLDMWKYRCNWFKNEFVKTFNRELIDEYLNILSAEIVTVPCIPEKLQKKNLIQ